MIIHLLEYWTKIVRVDVRISLAGIGKVILRSW